jgi:hypothetical protein
MVHIGFLLGTFFNFNVEQTCSQGVSGGFQQTTRRYFQQEGSLHDHSQDLNFYIASQTKTNSMAFSPQANYTNWATATCWQNLVPTCADRGVSRGQRGESPTVINLNFLHRSHYFSFK